MKRPARRRDDHGFARLRFANHPHTAISREPRHAEHAESGRDGCKGRIKFAEACAIRERVRAPSGWCQNDVAFCISWILRCDHPRNRFAGHHIAKLQRLRVGFAVIHPAAHVRIERKILNLEQKLPGTRRRDRGLLQTEVS
jgi:hypothetical protein